MNRFGRIFNIQIFGESHGPEVGIVIDGCPAGIPISITDFQEDMTRRQGGQGLGTTPRKEDDIPVISSGIFNGYTTGAPIHIRFENKNIRSQDYEKLRSIPRPSHADFVAHKKYKGYEDFRGGGHFSARLTTGIVAAGVIAKAINPTIQINAEIVEVGGCADIQSGLDRAISQKDSVGALVRCNITGTPIGWGEPYFDSIESIISHLVFSIPAVRGIEFGTGFAAARMFGLEHNDAIVDMEGATRTNHAGGIVGGISNGNDINFTVAFKPTASTPQMQNSLNWETGLTEDFSIKGRHDLCVALRAPVIVEAMAAIALADLKLLSQNG